MEWEQVYRLGRGFKRFHHCVDGKGGEVGEILKEEFAKIVLKMKNVRYCDKSEDRG